MSYALRMLPAGREAEVDKLLRQCNLPLQGIEHARDSTLTAWCDSTLAGCAALELYGADALLRSVAVAPAFRNAGVGGQLLMALERWARDQGISRCYLLTTTAEDYFQRHGFQTIPRTRVPEAVRGSVEFTDVCPESATVMFKALDNDRQETKYEQSTAGG